ncbi:type 1 periplasmic-binding domain-containing protein [Saccharicrinis fermentans]|uniref:D-xylose-binding periplasmic protein n=1 Tax=Saccharicrinis fermentans DSM 9555 = JCM 21142 TaxID=869213 RepID=W7YD30_9BACT|nr:hypothetical protein [Saccharicrinis fermentans]GAF02371.1 D-xylose-binding periplasmic protein precursor [Saccharicrinis fermentans DSM 9555 = JCM 21142]
MKTLQTLLIIALGTLLLNSCQHKPKVGLLMDTLERDRWKKDMKLIEEKVGELGGHFFVAIADADPDKQEEQAREMIENGIEVLIIVPVDSKKSR